MPSTKRRINLTVSEEIYEQIQTYKAENGLDNDATACLQLVVQQLKAYQSGKTLFRFMQETPLDLLRQNSIEGLDFLKATIDKAAGEKQGEKK